MATFAAELPSATEELRFPKSRCGQASPPPQDTPRILPSGVGVPENPCLIHSGTYLKGKTQGGKICVE